MLIARGISKIFRQGFNKVPAVKDADLEIKAGECVLINGPSGAGKSTLLHMLGGLAKPSKGVVVFKDKDIYSLSDGRRSKLRNISFGFIFQFYHLLPELNVLENVLLPAKIKGSMRKRNIKKRAAMILEKVQMGHRIKHRPSQLSGGEIQRTAIARALINSPDVLFCDEPTGNLDSHMAEEIYDLIKSMSRENDMAVLIVSHQKVRDGFYDKEYFMRDGILEEMSNAHLSEISDVVAMKGEV